ncbi:MAG TPA: glycosyltransferase family 1 protein [Patescibacteria group bacterium]|nr:glycosyltransferase family 1 protein [Patescibacteria group bacterium]
MILGIDASRANKENKTGTEWYSYHVIEELKKIMSDKYRVILYSIDILKGDLAVVPSNFKAQILNWPPKYLWTQIRLWWELIINSPDVLFVPAHTIPFLPIKKKIKIVVTVHDVGFKRYPRLYKPIQVWYHDLTMRKIIRRADVIITDSQFSKLEIMDLYSAKPEKIKVVYLGYDSLKYNQNSTRVDLAKYNISQPYLLYIGRLEKKKNILGIVQSFILAKEKHLDLKLVLVGNTGKDFEKIREIIKQNKIQAEIIMPGYVPEDDLPEIIRQAEIFVFPTLYEGFGLPIIQAMACGTPVITSNINPHLEVASDGAVFVSPQNPTDIAGQINKILADEEFKNDLIGRGLERVKIFSWRKTSEDIFEFLN